MVEIEGFDALFQMLLHGNVNGALDLLFASIQEGLFGGFVENKALLIEIFAVAAFSAFFTNLTAAFPNGALEQHGYYVAFLMIFVLSIQAFSGYVAIAEHAVEQSLTAMKLMIPAYTVAVTGTAGDLSGVAAYELMTLVLICVQYLILNLLFPLLQVYFLFQFINQLNREAYFTGWLSLMRDVINWGLKMISLFVIGMHLLKGMIAPMLDSVKITAIQKGISAIPGGSFVAAFTGIFLGCGRLIKNCIGVAGILILLFIMLVPLMKMLLVLLSYKLLAAMLAPVIDKRLLKAFTGMADAGKLMLEATFTAMILFVVSIALIARCTT